MSRPARARALAVAVAAAAAVAVPVLPVTASASRSFPGTVALPADFLPEGIAGGRGTTFYAGSRPGPTGGAVYVGDLRTGEGELLVDTDEPLVGVAPGQAVVAYDGTRVVGSATISSTRSPALTA